MIKVVSDELGIFDNKKVIMTKKDKQAINIITKSIIQKPQEIVDLLKQYGYDLPDDINRGQLKVALIKKLSDVDEQFIIDFAGIIVGQPQSRKKLKYSNAVDPVGAVVEAVSGIAGMLAGLFGKIGSGKQREIDQNAIDAQVTLGILNFKSAEQKGKTMIMIAVILGFLGLSAFMIYNVTKTK